MHAHVLTLRMMVAAVSLLHAPCSAYRPGVPETLTRNLYEFFPFPPTPVEDTQHIAHAAIPRSGPWGPRMFVGPSHLPDIVSHVWGGTLPPDLPVRVLFAGGGTGASMILLLNQLRVANVPCEAVHFDLSNASIELARQRARIAGFTRTVTFLRGSLLDTVGAIQRLQALIRGQGFHYIDCVGVLMATADPSLALRNLASVSYTHLTLPTKA